MSFSAFLASTLKFAFFSPPWGRLTTLLVNRWLSRLSPGHRDAPLVVQIELLTNVGIISVWCERRAENAVAAVFSAPVADFQRLALGKKKAWSHDEEEERGRRCW